MPDKKVLFIAPFWDQPPHVGIYRTSRYINWFLDAGFDVTVIRAGLKSDTYNSGQIEVIQIKHTISILNKIVFNIADKLSLRILKLLWNKFVYYTTIPDDLGGWSKKVSKSDAVIEAAKKANLIISTSPPNSAHLAGMYLAEKLTIDHLVDLRDGWIDEPLRKYLVKENIRKRYEEKLERNMLANAAHIIVTSQNWKTLLQNRIPEMKNKITVITNAYPELKLPEVIKGTKKNSIDLLYAGNFRGNEQISRLEAMLIALDPDKIYLDKVIKIKFYGIKGIRENTILKKYESKFDNSRIQLLFKEPVTRESLLKEMMLADGLLLPSISKSAIPSKTFEYIVTQKPVLVITMRESSTWQMCDELEAFYKFEILGEITDYTDVNRFLEDISYRYISANIPEKYSSAYLRKKFFESLNLRKIDE